MTHYLRCVLDVSVSTKQFINDPLTPKVNQLLDHLLVPETRIFVPDLFYIKSANTLLKYIRAGLYTMTEIQADLASLKALSFQVIPTTELMEEAIKIALNYHTSAYDGAYVALSHRVKAPLLTLDRKLVNALVTSSYNVNFFEDFSIPSLPNGYQ